MRGRLFATLVIVVFLVLLAAPPVSAATTLADGTYTANYTVLKADNDSASLANDYFAKPAKLIVKDGAIDVQIGLKNSNWIKSIEVNGVAPTVVSSDAGADTRTVQFRGNDLSQPIVSKIHVDIPEMDYNHEYTIRFSFAEDSIQLTEAAEGAKQSTKPTQPSQSQSTQNQSINTAAENPKTGDDTPIGWWVLLFAVCFGLLLASRGTGRST